LAACSRDGALLATLANGHLQALCRSVEFATQGGEIDVAFPSWQEFGGCGTSMPDLMTWIAIKDALDPSTKFPNPQESSRTVPAALGEPSALTQA
jgi:hypothetical protein